MPSIHILNLSTHVVSTGHKKLTKQRAQELMDDWITTGYFVELNDMVHFGPRAIGEFKDYLRLKYKESICICALCLQPTFKVHISAGDILFRQHFIQLDVSFVFQGIPCPNESCSVILHEACLQKYSTRNNKCPKCKNVWANSDDEE